MEVVVVLGGCGLLLCWFSVGLVLFFVILCWFWFGFGRGVLCTLEPRGRLSLDASRRFAS